MDFKAVKFKYSGEDFYHIYIKEHSSRSYDEDKPLGRTLFVVNIPPYINEHEIKKLFSQVGETSSIVLHRGIPSSSTDVKNEVNQNGFQTAYIVYKSRESLVKALNLISIGPLIDDEYKAITGLAKYAEEYNNSICDHQALYLAAVKAIKDYDQKEVEEKNMENEVDEEGWTVVTRKGRNPGLAFKESVEIKLHEKLKTKMKKKTLRNFYSFQIRETKRKHLTALREQHEEAKRKIEEMKKSRTFKPY